MISKLKKTISHRKKVDIILLGLRLKKITNLNFNMPKKKKIFVFLAADYGNLGDVAITYAQHKYLSQTFPEFHVTEIPISLTLDGLEYVRRIIKSEDIVTTVGGGNMGSLYEQIENFRQLVFEYFPKNKIISFPQTIDFSEDKNGQRALEIAKKTYQEHKHLLLLAREEKTFNFFQKHFPKNKSLLVPDIVMSLDRVNPVFERRGVVICLREDKEKKLSKKENDDLISCITSNYTKHSYRDTHIGIEKMSLKKRIEELFSIWDAFKKAELVVTDRLHGMIFCFITNTPAIVLLNNNHKVQSSYKWIQDSKNIHLIPDFSVENVQRKIEMVKNKSEENVKEGLFNHFSEVKEIVLNQL